MLNEGKGISNVIKSDIDIIYQLFSDNLYSSHNYKFGNDKIGYRDIVIKFNHLNNYYSNIHIDKFDTLTVNIGIPINGKESRIKENIAHELTHVVEILGLGDKEYPKYNKIKLSLREFKEHSMSKAMEYIVNIFYKTLDNEINANVSQTYIYIKSEGRCSREEATRRLSEWMNYRMYDDIKNIDLNLLESDLRKEEVKQFNLLLIKNGVKTISSENMNSWLKYWFKIFKRKADIFLKNSERILKEIEEDWKIYENYVSNTYDNSVILNYSNFIKII